MTVIKGAATELGTERIRKLLVQYSVPAIIAMTASSLYNMVDSIFIGLGVGPMAISGLALTFPLMNLAAAFGSLVGVGAATLISMRLGQRDYETAQRVLGNVLVLNLIIGIAFGLVALLFLDPILYFFGASEATIGYAREYMTVILLGNVVTHMYLGLNSVLRASGHPRKSMYATINTVVINTILDPLFIYGFGWGIRGAAIATVISQCISAALVVRCLVKETGPLRLDFRQLKIYPSKLKQIMQVGIPAGIQGMLFSLANVTVQSSVNSFGEVIMAGSSAAISIEQFIYSNINAFYQANVAFTSQNYGAGDYRRIKKIAMISVVTGVVTTELLSVLAVYFGPQLLGIYSPSAEVVAAGMVRLRWIALFYGLDAIMDVIVGSLRGVGYNILPMLVTLMGACASRLIWLSTVFRLPAYHRIEMVYIVYPLSWALTATTHLICYFFVSRKVDRELRAHEAELAARMEESPEEADS